MALREDQIIVDIMANADPLREINRRINDVIRQVREMEHTINRTGGNYDRAFRKMGDSTNWMMMQTRGMSQEALQMKGEMMAAYRAQRDAMIPYRNQLMKAQYDMFKLTQAADTYRGSANQFMREVQKAGLAHKKVTDAMMAADKMAKMGFIQGVGQMLARSTQANKIAANFDRMRNPLYQVNKGALAVADGMNRIAMQGQPAALALQMLGPNANMKQLNEMTMMISQGLMRMQMVAMAAAITSAVLYSSLHKAAMKSVAGYEKAFNRMQKAVRRAFEPMVQVFGAVMKKVYDFITTLANLVSAFNDAHPATARLLQGFLMLIPALTLILSPLAIGIGLLFGLKAAFGAAWMLIGPLITGLAAMSGTVYLVAAAIVGMVAGFRKAYRENEAFAKMIDSLTSKLGGGFLKAMSAVGRVIVTVFGGLTDAFAALFVFLFNVVTKVQAFASAFQKAHPVLYRVAQGLLALGIAVKVVMAALASPAVMAFATGLLATLGPIPLILTALGLLAVGLTTLYQNNEKFRNVVTKAWNNISDVAQQVFGFLAKYLTPIFNEIVQQASTFASAISAVFEGDFSKIGDIFAQIVPSLIGFLMGGIPGLLVAGARFIPAIAEGMQSNATQLSGVIGKVVQAITTFLVTQVPQFVNQGVKIITSLIQGIAQALPQVVTALSQVLLTIVNSLNTLLPALLQAGMQILQALIAGIVTLLPVLLTTGIDIIMTLVNGILGMIPTLIPIAIQIIMTLINTLVTLIPQLLQLGVQLIQGLLDGIVQALPLILNGALQLIMALVNAIVQNLPLLLTAGMQILQALLDGIMLLLPIIITTAMSIINQLVNTLVTLLPQLITTGMQLLTSLIQGITQMLPQLVTTAINLITQVVNTLVANLPQIIQSGVQIINSLISGLNQMLPALSQAAIQLILAMIQAILQNLPELLSAGVKLITALLDGINQMQNAILQAIIALGKGILDSIMSVDLSGAGADMMRGFLDGIMSMGDSILKAAGGIAEKAMGMVKGVLGIASPSKELFQIGAWTSEGFAIGISDNLRMVSDMSRNIAKAAIPQAPEMKAPQMVMAAPSMPQMKALAISLPAMPQMKAPSIAMPKIPSLPAMTIPKMPALPSQMELKSAMAVSSDYSGVPQGGSTTNNSRHVSIDFAPVFNITVNGNEDGESVRNQIKDASDDMFADLRDLFNEEVLY